MTMTGTDPFIESLNRMNAFDEEEPTVNSTKALIFKSLPKVRKLLDDIEIHIKTENYSRAGSLVDEFMEQSNLVGAYTEDLEHFETAKVCDAED
jgi:hypothetical protein